MKNKTLVMVFGIVSLLLIGGFGYYIYQQQQIISLQKSQIQEEVVAQQNTQANQATLEKQQSCDALKVEYSSECNQIAQNNQNSMTNAINKNCIGESVDAGTVCAQNFANVYKGQIGEQFIVSCENLKLAVNSCPLLPTSEFTSQ
jgi:hypothetical protein